MYTPGDIIYNTYGGIYGIYLGEAVNGRCVRVQRIREKLIDAHDYFVIEELKTVTIWPKQYICSVDERGVTFSNSAIEYARGIEKYGTVQSLSQSGEDRGEIDM